MLSAKSKAEIDAFFGFRPQPDTSDRELQRERRNRILKALSTGHSAPRELYDALPDEETGTIDRELHDLIKLGAVRWNGQRGPASRYYRV